MSIKTRTIFYDFTNGIASFWDWAVVTTTLGTMVEPHTFSTQGIGEETIQFDSTDEIVKINEIRAASRDKEQLILSGGDGHLNGGNTVPRNGR